MKGRGITLITGLLSRIPGLGGADGRFLLSRGAGDLMARVLGVGLGLLWVLILVRLLGPDEYGRFVYLLSATFFISLLGSLGMPVVASLYVARYNRTPGRARLITFIGFAVAAAIIGPIVASLGLRTVVDWFDGHMFDNFNLLLVLGFSAASALVQLFAAVDRAVERAVQGAVVEQILQRVFAL
ncbi:MAG: oligosaccharide flippase family protein, partial [Rhodospirillaceae bacterium]